MSDVGSPIEEGGIPEDAIFSAVERPDAPPQIAPPLREVSITAPHTDSATLDNTGIDTGLRDPNTYIEDEIKARKAQIGIDIDGFFSDQSRWLDDVSRRPELLSRRGVEDLPATITSIKESARAATVTIIENLERRGVKVDRNMFIQHLNLEIAAKVVIDGIRINGLPVPEYRTRRGDEYIPIDGNGNYALVYMAPFEQDDLGNLTPNIHQEPLLHGLIQRKNNITTATGIVELGDEQITEADVFSGLTKLLQGPEPFTTTRDDTNAYALTDRHAPFTGWQTSSRLKETKDDQYALVFYGATKKAPGGGSMPMISGSTNREISQVNIKIDRGLDEEATGQRIDFYKTWLEGVRATSQLKIPVIIYREKDTAKIGDDRHNKIDDYQVLAEL